MTKLWKPMLAAKPKPEDLDTVLAGLHYPLLASPKLDGIRATVQNGVLYSRSLKRIPNRAMQDLWGREEFNGLDGEIIVGPPTAEDCFNRTTSVVMSAGKPAEGAMFHVFDKFGPELFEQRLQNTAITQQLFRRFPILMVPHTPVGSTKELVKYEAKMLKAGHEGIMLRDPNGTHKQGRSTLKEGGLIAVKRFVDAEALILDTYEQEENTNAKELNELGKMKRSSHKAGKVGKGTLGGFTVCMINKARGPFSLPTVRKEDQFNIGTGMGLTDAVRAELWARRERLPGKIIKLRYQKVGTMDKPRIPIFLGFRDERDL